MAKPLKILYLCAEAEPFVKTGGLADVSRALPAALKAKGHDVRVALPCYGTVPAELRGEQRATCVANLAGRAIFGALRESAFPVTDVPVYLVQHDGYFMRAHPYGEGGAAYPDNPERFGFFCLALLDALPQTGWIPDVVHCHDWHTAPVPIHLQVRYSLDAALKQCPSVFTIHNLAYQGQYAANLLPSTGLPWELFRPDLLEFHGDFNLMKGAILLADKVSTVSRRYATEIRSPEFGHGLDAVLAARGRDLSGIVNGVDYTVWSPVKDRHIEANYSSEDLRGGPYPPGKAKCKHALRHRLHLPAGDDPPLYAMVSRLVWDKGIDVLVPALRRLLDDGAQVVILGMGELHYQLELAGLVREYPASMRFLMTYDEAVAHQIYAGADFYVMPSHREPCGLSQLYALAYGTVPIVHRTGGLADTVVDATPRHISTGHATGLVYEPNTPEALYEAFVRSLDLYDAPDMLRTVRRAGMRRDFSWAHASTAYVRLYRQAMRTRQGSPHPGRTG